MSRTYFVIALSALLLLSGAARSQTAAPAPPGGVGTLTAEQVRQSQELPKRGKLAPRRPTRQIVGTPLPTVTEGYRPSLYPPATASGMPDPVGTLHVAPSAPPPPAVAPLPVPVGACSGAACTGADGVRYNGGVGNVKLDPAGRTCHQVGVTLQCF